MKISVYSSLFNVENGLFDIDEALKNWSKYADEIVIATFPDQEEKVKNLNEIKYFGFLNERKSLYKNCSVKVVSEETSLDDPLFDGKLKNAALQACSNEIVIQQDFDERIGGDKHYWKDLAENILEIRIPLGCYIPVIDLYKDLDSYKSVNMKWYIHTKAGTKRGPVNFAIRNDGTIDVTKSDTCELINHNGDLISSTADLSFKTKSEGKAFSPQFPHIVHLGYLNLENRVENNKFWSEIWSARNGKKVEVATDVASLEKEAEAKPHGLKREWWL